MQSERVVDRPMFVLLTAGVYHRFISKLHKLNVAIPYVLGDIATIDGLCLEPYSHYVPGGRMVTWFRAVIIIIIARLNYLGSWYAATRPQRGTRHNNKRDYLQDSKMEEDRGREEKYKIEVRKRENT